MKKSLHFIFLTVILLFLTACSSTKQLDYTSKSSSTFKISKQICTSTNNLSLYTSTELKNMLLYEARQEILFDFLNDNAIFTTAYTNLDILNKIEIKNESFEMSDDFRFYCLKVDANIADSDIIYDEIVLQNYISNYAKESL